LRFSLVVPLWNEGRNVDALVAAVEAAGLCDLGMAELVLVDNGCTDDTRARIEALSAARPWVTLLTLPENRNYGGGVMAGLEAAREQVIAYIPGDLQIAPSDVARLAEVFQARRGSTGALLVKGHRTTRHDPWQTRIVSVVYTFLANLLLGLAVHDANGLPKMFDRGLLDALPPERPRTFVFDAMILQAARRSGRAILEVPVTFHARRVGVSSWSRQRLRVYWEVFAQLWQLRSLNC
jgi:glycosyltransferase involved in cell wall biosynthesis